MNNDKNEKNKDTTPELVKRLTVPVKTPFGIVRKFK